MDPAHKPVVTEAMYLAMERVSPIKHEFHGGEMWAMAGASPRHNRLATACTAQLDNAARKTGSIRSIPFSSDQRVHVPATGDYCYPDVTVVCGEPQYHPADPDSITNPRLIVEVLSRTTEKHDCGEKFEDYRSIDAFQEYVLVWQDRVKVEVRRREGERRWTIEEFGPGQQIDFRSIGATLDIDTLYEGVFALRGDEPRAPRA